MKTAKIRRTGNSNAVTLSPDLEPYGYTAGAEVLIDVLPNGDLQVTLAAATRDRIRVATQQTAEKIAADRARLEDYARRRAEALGAGLPISDVKLSPRSVDG